jgi:hypothetical protein
MIEVVTEEMDGSDRVPDLKTDYERALVGRAKSNSKSNNKSSNESEMARSLERTA